MYSLSKIDNLSPLKLKYKLLSFFEHSTQWAESSVLCEPEGYEKKGETKIVFSITESGKLGHIASSKNNRFTDCIKNRIKDYRFSKHRFGVFFFSFDVSEEIKFEAKPEYNRLTGLYQFKDRANLLYISPKSQVISCSFASSKERMSPFIGYGTIDTSSVITWESFYLNIDGRIINGNIDVNRPFSKIEQVKEMPDGITVVRNNSDMNFKKVGDELHKLCQNPWKT